MRSAAMLAANSGWPVANAASYLRSSSAISSRRSSARRMSAGVTVGSFMAQRGLASLRDRRARQLVELTLERSAVGQGTERRTDTQPAGVAGLGRENGLQRREEGWRLHHDVDRGLHARFDIGAVDHALDQLRSDVGHAADGAGAAG